MSSHSLHVVSMIVATIGYVFIACVVAFYGGRRFARKKIRKD